MNLNLRSFVGGWVLCALVALAPVFFALAQAGDDPERQAILSREQEYIRQLQDVLRMPDFASLVIEDLKKRYPDAAAALKVLELRGLLSQGKFEEVRGIIARQPNLDGPDAWAMKLAMADSLYAFGRADESFALYEGFFVKFPQPTPQMESFYVEAAYKYPQMLLATRMEKRALAAYKRLLGVKLPRDAMRQVQADAAELAVKVAESETDAAAKTALLDEADKMANQLLWDQDMWFGKGIVIKAHILVLRGQASKAQSLIEDYMGPLKMIHDALVAQEAEEGIVGLVRMSPMAQCRFLLAVMLEEEAMKIAADPAGDIEQVKNLLLGERLPSGGRKPNGAYQHFVNVFGKFPDSQWAMDAGEREQAIRAFIKERFGQDLRPSITPEQFARIRQKQFQEARQKFANNQFEAGIPLFLDVLNRFPLAEEAVIALGELTRACLETRGDDGYEELLADTVVAHLAERFCASEWTLAAGAELQRLAEHYGSLGLGDKRRRIYDLFFRNFPQHPDVPQRLIVFGGKALEDGDDAAALGYFERLAAAYPASAWYGDALSQIAVIHGRRSNFTNEIATLETYMEYLVKSGKPGLDVATTRLRIAQATRAVGLAQIRGAEDETARVAGSMLLIRGALAYGQALKDLDAIPAGVAIDAKQAALLREQSSFQTAACLAQVVAPPEAAAKTRSQAIDGYLAFVKDFPKSDLAPAALIKAGTMYTVLKQADKSQEVFARLRKDYPESEEARSSVPMLAASLMELGLRGEAVAKYKEMFTGAGGDVFPDYQLLTAARALADAREYDSALQGFDRVIASAQDPAMLAQARFGRAQSLVGTKRFGDARAELETFVTTYSRSALVVDAHLLLADAASAEGETERDNDRRLRLFNKAVEAFQFVRNYRKEPQEMLKIDSQVGQTMIRKMNAEKALGLEEQAGLSRARAIVAFKQLIFTVPPGQAALDPLIEQAYLLSIPLELEHKKFQAAADACEEFLASFGDSRNVPQVRTWLNQANIELPGGK